MTSGVTEDAAVLAADANLLQAARTWAAASADGTVEDRDGVLMASAGSSMRSFNNVFVSGWSEKAGARLEEVRAYFEGEGLRFRVRALEGRVSDEALAGCGLAHAGGIPCLVEAPLAERPHDMRGLRVRKVADRASLRDHVEVVAAGFEWEPDALGRVFSEAFIDQPSWSAYVGYSDGLPVASSQLLVSGDVAGIYYVATVEGARRRGFGEAMTRHAMNEGAARGCTIASLQASPAGYPIYRRMGFHDLSYYRTYIRKEVEHAGRTGTEEPGGQGGRPEPGRPD